MTMLTIGPMEARDLDELAELERRCFSTPWSRDALAAELAKDNAVFLVARETDGTPVGYVGMNYVLDEGYLDNLAVDPARRRQGMARLLLGALLDCCARLELAFVTLEVRPSNIPAIGLYTALGFREAGRRKGFYQHPSEDGMIMTKIFPLKGTIIDNEN